MFDFVRHASLLCVGFTTLVGIAAPVTARAQGYDFTSGTGSFSSIAGGGQQIHAGVDDQSASATLPFNFTFFGQVVPYGDSITVNSNGYFGFSSGGTISVFGDDLAPVDAHVATLGSPGSRIFVIEWYAGLYRDSSAGMMYAQARLHEGSGDIEFVYAPINPPSASGVGYVGIDSVDGRYRVAASCAPSCSFADVAGRSFLFSPVEPGGAIEIVTTMLPAGRVGTSYSATLEQTGGTAPYWTFVSGSLPYGLEFDEQRALVSGTPESSGNFSFTVRAEEFGRTPDEETISLYIASQTGDVRVSTTSLPEAYVGEAYNAMLTAEGGLPPYAFQLVAPPSWLRVDSSGLLSGTPNATGIHTVVVSVYDNALSNGTANLELRVIDDSALAVVASLPDAVVERPYAQRLATGGRPPITASLAGGTLPAGLVIRGDSIEGTPTVVGSVTFRVRLIDGEGTSIDGDVALTVGDYAELEIVDKLITVPIDSDVDRELRAKGGLPPYTWTRDFGEFPAGLRLEGGHLVGRIEEAATATVGLTVTDAENARASASVVIRASAQRRSSGGGGGRGGGCGCSNADGSAGGAGAWIAALIVGAGRRLAKRRRR